MTKNQSAIQQPREPGATFTDSQENVIVEFVREHPELYDKEHGRFHDRQRQEALWAEISAELKFQPFDVRRWFESQRTRSGKLSKQQSGQAPREMTKRQSWVYHVRRKGANKSSGFEASPNTSRHEESRGSTTDTEHLESSVLRESRSQPILTSTPVSTDSKILEQFDQMRTLISGFLQQKSDRQPFFDYVASEADKMTQEEFEDLKGRIFRDTEAVKKTSSTTQEISHYYQRVTEGHQIYTQIYTICGQKSQFSMFLQSDNQSALNQSIIALLI